MTATPRHLREGVIGGLIGATIVAVWFLIYDAARGAPFRTPTLLGSAALRGVENPQAVPVSTGLVVQYTVLHGVVFALVGILIAFLIVSAQRQPARRGVGPGRSLARGADDREDHRSNTDRGRARGRARGCRQRRESPDRAGAARLSRHRPGQRATDAAIEHAIHEAMREVTQ